MMYGAYSASRRSAVTRIFCRFIWFSLASLVICYLYVWVWKLLWICPQLLIVITCGRLCSHTWVLNFSKALQEGTDSAIFKIYVFVIGIYAGIQLFFSALLRIPFCHRLTEPCDQWSILRLIKWMHQVPPFKHRQVIFVVFCGLRFSEFQL